MSRSINRILLAMLALVAPAALAQSTAGAGSLVVIPTAAVIAAYDTEVFVRNPNASGLTLNVRYYQSNDATAPPGLRSCTPVVLAANQSASFNLGAQCGLGAGDDFGMIILEDTSTERTHPFFAYSRTQTPTGIGFSVEGFPIGSFSGAPAHVLGLRKLAASPNYRSNCFIGSLGESVNWQVLLVQSGTETVLGSLSGSLGPYQTHRILDVFASAGLAGDFTNVRATFSTSTANNPAFIAFCTLETTANGSADFRIAKSIDASDARQQRLACYGQDSCNANTPSVTDPAQLLSPAQRNIHFLILDQPDYVSCNLVGSRAADLQIQLRQPGDMLASAPFAGGGGANQTAFYIYTGERSTIAAGSTTRWYIDVSMRAGAGDTTVPANYGITCRSGNGVSVPWLGARNP